jgi:hypothetical protein
MVRSEARGATRTVAMETKPVRAGRETGTDEETR